MLCPETLPEPRGGNDAQILGLFQEWAEIYFDCKTRHNGLVKAVQ